MTQIYITEFGRLLVKVPKTIKLIQARNVLRLKGNTRRPSLSSTPRYYPLRHKAYGHACGEV